MNYRNEIATTPELATWYDNKYREMGDGWNTPAEECHKHLDDLGVPFDKNRWLLDVGCGAGHFLAEAQKRVKTMGIEISREGVDLCHKRGVTNVTFGSIEDMSIVGSFDYVTSIGSLEHIVDLSLALDNIRALLAPYGKFYFYCPNERWQYFDQPNERTMTDAEWMLLFSQHGLNTTWYQRWGANQDNTAFIGHRSDYAKVSPEILGRTKLNCGSGQRPFEQKHGWCNIDIQDKYGPDLVADWNDLSIFHDNSMELVVAHHTIEHVGCGEADGFIKEAHRVLKPGGSLLVFVPDLRALAQRWLTHQLDDYSFLVNVYGAYMGNESDRHRWGYTRKSLETMLDAVVQWKVVHGFNWRPIEGADIAKDWWILGMECVK